jgi:hypothetical protein
MIRSSDEALRALPVVLAGLAIATAAGCDDESRPGSGSDATPADPLAAVSESGTRTFARPILSVSLRVASARAHYEATGLIEPKNGRFRVELGVVSSPRASVAPDVVIGVSGEGYEGTYEETTEKPFSQGGERCWFNPHSPVGSFLGTASVEESVRLTSAVLESLGEEVRTAASHAGDAYEITLDPSATHPRNDFHESKRRVWGDRNLLRQLEGPIEVVLSGPDTVAEIAFGLRDYEPYVRETIPRVRIEATLAPTDEELVTDPPTCQALE